MEKERRIKFNNITDALYSILSFENPIVSMLIWCLSAAVLIDQTQVYQSILMLQLFLAVWVALMILMIRIEYKKSKCITDKVHLLSDDRLISAIIFVGFIIRLVYVVRTGSNVYQNDGGTFGPNEGGHLGYIYYVFENWQIADFNPTERWQYYHPPFHYFVAAVWAKLNQLSGYSDGRIAENIQILTLFYSGATLVVVDKIMRLFDAKRLSRALVISILCVYPYFIMTAGAINNDCLVTLLTLIAIYYTIVWYREPSLKHIIILAVLIGLSMMTKMSGALIAPAVAVIFLIRFIKDRKIWTGYIKQFLIFGVISAVLGLWYPIRNLIRFNMPINYVMKLGEDMAQYIGKCSTVSRFFGFGRTQFETYYLVWDNREPNYSYNIFVSLLKFGAFNEWKANLDSFSLGNKIAYALLIMIFIITVMIIAIRTYGLIKSNKAEREIKIFFYLISLIISVSYFKFCIEYAQICTMNVRYVLIPIIINTIGFGLGMDRIEESDCKYKKVIVNGVVVICVIFAVLSLISIKATLGYAC